MDPPAINEEPAFPREDSSTATAPCLPTGGDVLAIKGPGLWQSCRDGLPPPPSLSVQSSNWIGGSVSKMTESPPSVAVLDGGGTLRLPQSRPDASQLYSFPTPLMAMGYPSYREGGDGGSTTFPTSLMPSALPLDPLQLLIQYHQQYQQAGSMMMMHSYNEALMRGRSTVSGIHISSPSLFLFCPRFSHQDHAMWVDTYSLILTGNSCTSQQQLL
jgi:hypothetical protein